jgi:hypothetical protein
VLSVGGLERVQQLEMERTQMMAKQYELQNMVVHFG